MSLDLLAGSSTGSSKYKNPKLLYLGSVWLLASRLQFVLLHQIAVIKVVVTCIIVFGL